MRWHVRMRTEKCGRKILSLFHKKVLSQIDNNASETVPERHARILGDWAATIESRSIFQQTELALHGHFTQSILVEVLGYEGFGNRDAWTLQREQQIGTGTVDVALGHFSGTATDIVAPFELKPAKVRDLDAVMPGRNKTPVQQAWEYAMDARGARWVLVSNYLEIRLYAIGYGRASYERWMMRDLIDPSEYARFHTLLSANNLLEGATLQLLKDSETAQEDITNALYVDYRQLRVALFQHLRTTHPSKTARRTLQLAQTILDRVLFIAFAEDTGLLPPQTLERTFSQHNPFAPVPVWQNFIGLFNAIDQGQTLQIDGARIDIPAYNGGLFKRDEEISSLRVSDEICESFKAIGRYEFQSEVSVEVLGHILEQSISDVEELAAAANEEEFDVRVSRRRTEGVYYTPSYVTRYIVENTVGQFLEQRKNELGVNDLPGLTDADYESVEHIRGGRNRGQLRYNDNIRAHVDFWTNYKAVLAEITILDPACGSGAFLIAAFDYLLNEGKLVNAELANLRAGQHQLFRWDRHILQNNLFGVDLNAESIEITKLSLWLKTANPREPLTYLDDKIRVGNSVVNDPSIAPRDSFDWKTLNGGVFDVVVANPPYVSALELSRHYGKRAKDYWKSRFASATGAYDLYVLFMELALNLVRENGFVGLITPNKYLASPYAVGIREFIRTHAHLCEVLDLSADRVFQDPSVYPIVSIMKRTTEPDRPTRYARRDETTGRVEYIRQLAAHDLDALPGRMFSLLLSQYSQMLSGLLQRCNALKDIAEVNATSTAAEADLLSQVIVEHVSGAAPLVNTGTIDRFVPLWGIAPLTAQGRIYTRPSIQLDGVSLSPHRIHTYRSPKIVFAKMALRPEAFLDGSGEYCSINTNCVFDAKVPLEYLIAILNSKAMAFIYDQLFGPLRMSGGYFQFQAPQIRALPIPEVEEEFKIQIVNTVRELINLTGQTAHLKRDFIGLLVADFGLDGTTRKLSTFESLSWKDFAGEIEHHGVELRGAVREDWHQRFEDRIAAIHALQTATSALDRTIDSLVFRAFGFDASMVTTINALVPD